MSNLAGATGAITNIAYLGFTLGALGLALNFTQRAFDQVPDYRGKTRRSKPVFDTQLPKKKNQDSYDFYSGYQTESAVPYDYGSDYGMGYGYGMKENGKKKQSLSSDDMFDLSRYF